MANIFTDGNSCEEQDYLTEMALIGVDPVIARATLPQAKRIRNQKPKLFGFWEESFDGLSNCGYFVVSAYQPEVFALSEHFYNDEHPLVGAWGSIESVQAEAKRLGFDIQVTEL